MSAHKLVQTAVIRKRHSALAYILELFKIRFAEATVLCNEKELLVPNNYTCKEAHSQTGFSPFCLCAFLSRKHIRSPPNDLDF